MNVEQIYTGCLAQGAYYIESEGEAAIIDPLRETQPYLQMAEKRGAVIRYIFETHFHADFVSGHVDLAEKTGAPIVYGPTTMKTGFKSYIARDGEEFKLGKATIRLIHTPGHTLESSCYLLIDENGKETSLFTGDTLFIGDVGRPDLAQHVIADLTQEKLASHLYDSLRNKIMPLSDELIVYPGHGAGSACGKNMSKETTDTLGNQKKTNYALQSALSREEFISLVLNGLTTPPSYFPKNVLMNIQGYRSIDEILEQAATPIPTEVIETWRNDPEILLLDTRDAEAFGKSFIPGSLNIGIEGSFAVWAGTLIKDLHQKIVLICEPGREKEAATRLARVGFDGVLGYLKGGFASWMASGNETDSIQSVDARILAEQMIQSKDTVLIDVRKKSEYDSEHILGSMNQPLDYILDNPEQVPNNGTAYVHCAGGYRSMVFVSLLRKMGFRNLINVSGGFSKLKESGRFELSEYVCPSTML